MSLRPIISRTGTAKNEVIRPENLSKGARSNSVHRAGFQVNEYRPGHVLPTGSLVVVNVDPLQLKIGIPRVLARGIDSVLVADHFPKLRTDLIAALAHL